MAYPPMPGVSLTGVTASLARLLRLLDVKGRSPGFDLSSAVVPVVDVSRLVEHEGGIDGYLNPQSDTDAYAGWANVAASVGNPDHVQLYNPVGSGVIALVDKIVAYHDQVTNLLLRVSSAQAANLHANAVRKLLGPFGVVQPQLQLRWQNATLGASVQRITQAANATSILEMRRPVVVTPGSSIGIETDSLNVALTVGFELRVVTER